MTITLEQYRAMEAQLPAVLDAGSVAPPVGQAERSLEHAYPLAVDRDGDLGAVSFAVWDPYPDIKVGWWCVAACVQRDADGTWPAFVAAEHDNTTTPRPFERPEVATASTVGFIDWGSNGGQMGFGEHDGEEDWRHSFFGIAPIHTARLVLTLEDGRSRDLQITPWCGAYVAYYRGTGSMLTGYDAAGHELGSIEAA